jgi:hypothetical protein
VLESDFTELSVDAMPLLSPSALIFLAFALRTNCPTAFDLIFICSQYAEKDSFP